MKNHHLTRLLEIGGILAGVILVAFGVVALVLGVMGRSTVQTSLKDEYITGSADMSPEAIAPEVSAIQASQKKIAADQVKARVPEAERYAFTTVSAPSCSVANEAITTGDEGRCFAQYMRIHALGSSSGLTYSQLGRYKAKPDAPPKETDFAGGTSNAAYAEINADTGQPEANAARDTWVTETALSSALNLGYTAEQVALFGVVVGVALLLSGIGFLILAVAVLHRRRSSTEASAESSAPLEATPAH